MQALTERCGRALPQPLLLVVPSWEAGLQVLRRAAARLGGRACLGVQAMPVEALVERLGGPALAEAGVRRLPPWGLEWLAERAAPLAGDYYAGVADRPGFARALAGAAAFLRLHGVAPERLERAAREAPADERGRWQALAAVYRAICESLAPAGPYRSQGGWADAAAVWWAALREVQEGRAALRLGAPELAVWLPPRPYDPGHLWYSLEQALSRAGGGLALRRVPLELEPPPLHASEVRLVAASDEVREAELAVEAVLEAAARGVPLYRTAVIVRSDDGQRRMVADAARRAGLEAYVPGAVRPSRSPSGLALLRWLQLVEEGLPPGPTMAWLASSPLRPERFGVEPERWQPGAWEALCARAGLVAGLDAWERRLSQAGAVAGDDPRWPDLERVARALLQEARGMAGRSGWRAMAEACRRFVQESLQPEPDRQAVMDRLERLAQLDELAGGGPGVDVGRLRQALAALLEAPSGSQGRFEQGGPAILEARQAVGCSFDTTVVVGLNEPGWPARGAGSRSPLLAEWDMPRLELGDPAERSAWEARQEALLFGAAVASAERRLVVSRARAEALTGRGRVDSPYLALLQPRAARPECTRAAAAREPLDLPALRVQLAARHGRRAEPHLARCHPQAARGAAARRARWSRRFTEWDGLVGPDGPAPASLLLSPTALERLARCPRRYFFERRLQVAPPEDPEASEGIQGRVLGSVAHRALQLFFERWAREVPGGAGPLSLPPGWETWVDEAVAQAVAEQPPASAAGAGLTRLQQEAVAELLRRFLPEEMARLAADGWQPAGVELTVETSLTVDGGLQLRLPNRLDRLDLRRDPGTGRVVAARVVDYKTSRWAPAPDRLEGGASVQLPLYLLAAAAGAGLPVEACLAERVALREDGTPERATLEGARWSELEPRVRAVAAALVRLLLDGSFPGLPPSERECSACPFSVVCGPEALRQARRKEEAPPIQALQSLRERYR